MPYLPLWERAHAGPAELIEEYLWPSFQQCGLWPVSSAQCTGVLLCLTGQYRLEMRRNFCRQCMCLTRCSDGRSPVCNSHKSYSERCVAIWRCGMCCKIWLVKEQVLSWMLPSIPSYWNSSLNASGIDLRRKSRVSMLLSPLLFSVIFLVWLRDQCTSQWQRPG